MPLRSVSLTALSAVLGLLVAGCAPARERLPVLTALRLAELADRGDCAALQRAAIAAVNRHEVPGPLQEQLLSDVNELAAGCAAAAAHALAERLRREA